MTDDACDDMRLLIQAEIDGELDAARAAVLATHFADCPGCAAARARLIALSADLRRDLPYHAAPAALREAVSRWLPVPLPRRPRAGWRTALAARWREATAFAGGAALAASLALALVLPHGEDIAETVVSDHIRALQPGHMMDVVSIDRHTVKPWFAGRTDFSPPVKDLAKQGFPLAGGRLEFLDGHLAAALVYYRAKHAIDLLVWPARGEGPRAAGARNGYNFVRWTQDGMEFWAVSDLNAAELADFVRLWRAAG